jgi:hypothetical protein
MHMAWLYDENKTITQLKADYYTRVANDLWGVLAKAAERAPGLTIGDLIKTQSDSIMDDLCLEADIATEDELDAQTIIFVSGHDDHAADEAMGEAEAKQLGVKARAAAAFVADANDLLNNEWHLQGAARSLGVKL